jgi:hypothetical protein
VDKGVYAYFIPGLALVFLVVDAAAAYFFYQREKLASYFLSLASLPVQAIFLVAAMVLIMANSV